MGLIHDAVMAETRCELENLLEQRPNWSLSDEYKTIFLFGFGSGVNMNCTLRIRPHGQVHWTCARATADGRYLGNLRSAEFFPQAAAGCVELVSNEVLPFLSDQFEPKETIRIALFKALQSSRRSRRKTDHPLDDVLDLAGQSLKTSEMSEQRKAGWRWFLATVKFLYDSRPLAEYRKVCAGEGREWLQRLSLCRYAEKQLAELRGGRVTPKVLEEDLYRHGWYRDHADLETMLLADGLI